MKLLSSNNTFTFAPGKSFSDCERLLESGAKKFTRICYTGNETMRLYIIYSYGCLKFLPCRFNGEIWAAMPSRDNRLFGIDPAVCHSEDELRREAERGFSIAFPEAEESYYADLPSVATVLFEVSGYPSTDGLDRRHIAWSFSQDKSKDLYEGVCTVYCRDGILQIPAIKSDEVSEIILIPEKYTLLKATASQDVSNKLAFIVSKVSEFIHKLFGRNRRGDKDKAQEVSQEAPKKDH